MKSRTLYCYFSIEQYKHIPKQIIAKFTKKEEQNCSALHSSNLNLEIIIPMLL
jgi:hypothetical protein